MAVKKMSIPAIPWRGDRREKMGGQGYAEVESGREKGQRRNSSDHGYVASAGSATEGWEDFFEIWSDDDGGESLIGHKIWLMQVLKYDILEKIKFSVAEYFGHFPILEIDYTFYRPLLESKGSPTSNLHVLKSYRQQMKKGDLLLLKAPQIVIARKLRRGGAFVENEYYLNTDIFTKQFYEPAVEILGPCLHGIIFEQEYHVKNDRIPVSKLAQDLD